MTVHSHDPRDPNLKRPAERQGIASGTMLAVAMAVLAGIGIAWYAMSDRPTSASVNTPAIERSVPDSTTGRGNIVPAPGREQNIPNQASPAPAR